MEVKLYGYTKINRQMAYVNGYQLPGNAPNVIMFIQLLQTLSYIPLVEITTRNHFIISVRNVTNDLFVSISIKIHHMENSNGYLLLGIVHDVNIFGCNHLFL